MFGVPGVSVNECPRSYITNRSIDLVQLCAKAQHAQNAAGASLYGPNLSQWPSWAAEAMIRLEIERVAIENARCERERLSARNRH